MLQLDLASKESIQKFVDDFHASERKLHVLINNAGVSLAPKDTKVQLTKDNFELTMGTNHLGKEAAISWWPNSFAVYVFLRKLCNTSCGGTHQNPPNSAALA